MLFSAYYISVTSILTSSNKSPLLMQKAGSGWWGLQATSYFSGLGSSKADSFYPLDYGNSVSQLAIFCSISTVFLPNYFGFEPPFTEKSDWIKDGSLIESIVTQEKFETARDNLKEYVKKGTTAAGKHCSVENCGVETVVMLLHISKSRARVFIAF